MESPGVHELHFVNSCIFFGSSPIKIDTSNLLVSYQTVPAFVSPLPFLS
jgi:hypothetical protein